MARIDSTDLRGRLERAIARLEERRQDPQWRTRSYERDRISARIEGLQQALSYLPADNQHTAPEAGDLEHQIARALAYGYIPNALNPDGKLEWRDDWEASQAWQVDLPDRRYQARVIAAHLTRLGVTLPGAPAPDGEHCTHWQEGDGDCHRCGRGNWHDVDTGSPTADDDMRARALGAGLIAGCPGHVDMRVLCRANGPHDSGLHIDGCPDSTEAEG